LQPGIKALFFSMSLPYSRIMVPEWGRGREVRKTEQTFPYFPHGEVNVGQREGIPGIALDPKRIL
jgi:hypothetical protein